MKTRISGSFAKLKKEGRKAFIPYIMAGDPSLEKTKEVVLLFEECGADIIELGVPFSDPLADGPTIQRAAERALLNGITLRKVISFVREMRQSTQTPLVLMTYYNPVFKYGLGSFVEDAVDAGVDGVIIPDLPPDEASDLIHLSKKAGLDTIFLLAPTSTEERIRKVAQSSRGFLYYVSVTGITGSGLRLDGSMDILLSAIRKHTNTPIAVGFGVSVPGEASAVAKMADGVIVGSAIIKKLHEAPEHLKEFLTDLRRAIQ